MRGAPFLIVAGLIVLGLAGAAVAKAGQADDDLLVVDLALGSHTLSEGMLAGTRTTTCWSSTWRSALTP
jgi:hypothetical protein